MNILVDNPMVKDGRKWLPSAYMDEWVPETLKGPEDFICFVDGKYQIGGFKSPDGMDDYEIVSLSDGDIVEFDYLDGFGWFYVKIGEDFEPISGSDYPHHANCHRYEEDICDSLEDLVKSLGDDDGFGDVRVGEEIVVQAYSWHTCKFVFKLNEDLTPTLSRWVD